MPKTAHKPIKNILKSIQKKLESIDKQLDNALAIIFDYQAKLYQLLSEWSQQANLEKWP